MSPNQVNMVWPTGTRSFEIVPRANFDIYTKEPGIAVFLDVAPDGTETVLHVREYDRFPEHARAVLQHPAIRFRENIVALVSQTFPPALKAGIQAKRDWLVAIKIEVQLARNSLAPVVKE